MEVENEENYFENTKYIINPTIHKFLYVLVKYLLLGKDYMKKTKDKLEKFIKKSNIKNFNKDIILIQNNCDSKNFEAILSFIKTHNSLLASEILENILIRVLSFSFNTKSDEFFGKYLYNNLSQFKKGNKIFLKWIEIEMDNPLFNETNKTLDFALENDDIELFEKKNFEQKKASQSTFIQILFNINDSKYIYNINKNKDNKENSDSINKSGSRTFSQDLESCYLKKNNLFYENKIGEIKKIQKLSYTSSILISTYIYHQIKKSPLIKYSQTKSGLENIPFLFELSEAGIFDYYSDIIFTPIRIEPKISYIEFNSNYFNDHATFELHKALMFNKNIKIISFQECLISSLSLDTFNEDFILFNNYNVKELNLSSNLLKSDADINLSKLITHFKGLKSLILSNNILKSGLGSFFATLKNLYRKNQSNLEELYLVNCELDDISFYELGELLKSKYCKLKCLCLNENKIPSDINFFKALKKNRSLEEIYFYGCGINSEKTDEIENLINNTHLQYLYLYANKIHDFNQYIRILYKTKLVKNKKEKKKNIFIDNPDLFNLNMSNSDCYNQNAEKLDILLEGMKNTNLSILDLSSVLKEANNYDYNLNYKYYNTVNKIIDYLSNKQKEFKKALKEFLEIQLNNENNNNNLDNKDKKDFESFYINNINNPNFKHDTYIREKYNELFSDLSINKEKENENFQKLINYIHFKRDEILSEQNKKIIESKKLIII